ncbi:MAG: type II toxin-antitoxin system CcdA family antitoxin [Hyphomicrobiales bacterium]|nr:type II toxin-antitoxin system CcdA family antitoxin [Hyphomicrobiales bacterium]
MRSPLFDPKAKKKTVSLTINSDLYAKARAAGINVSAVAGQALEDALRQQLAAIISAEVKAEVEAHDRYIAEHGNRAEMLRDYLAECDDAAGGIYQPDFAGSQGFSVYRHLAGAIPFPPAGRCSAATAGRSPVSRRQRR